MDYVSVMMMCLGVTTPMLIETLMYVVYDLLDYLLFFEVPMLPNEVYYYIDSAMDYIVAGAGILNNYTPLTYLMLLFGIVLTIDLSIMIYKFVMWVIKKVPFLGVKD